MQVRITGRSNGGGDLARLLISHSSVAHTTFQLGHRAVVEVRNSDVDDFLDELDAAGFSYDVSDDDDTGKSGGIRSYERRADEDDGDMSQSARKRRPKHHKKERKIDVVPEWEADEYQRLLSDGVPSDEVLLSAPRKIGKKKPKNQEGDEGSWFKMPKYRP